jgi:hypothetical protein
MAPTPSTSASTALDDVIILQSQAPDAALVAYDVRTGDRDVAGWGVRVRGERERRVRGVGRENRAVTRAMEGALQVRVVREVYRVWWRDRDRG